MEQLQRKPSPQGGEATELVALVRTGNVDGALALNAQIAEEMPFATLVEGWFIGKIEEEWPNAKAIATEAWAKARASAPDWLREVAALCDADCAAFRGRERLAELGARLARAKPKLGEARAKVEALDAQLGAVKPKPAPVHEPAPKAKSKYSADVFRPAPLPPEGATALEQLTYPRGLVGHVMEYMLDTNALPDRWMALAGALSVCAKALDRKVLGPRDNSVVLFILILAESGAGKNHILNCIKTILKAVGLESAFIGTGIASTQSVEQVLEGMGGEDGNPSVLLEIDEYGSFLNRISSKSQSGNVAEIPSILCSLWGHSPQASWKGSIKMHKKMVEVHGPAFAIFGASTEPMFYKALKSKQISGGFVSRHLAFNAGRGAERMIEPKYSWVACPKWLMKALKEIAGRPAPIDNTPIIDGLHVVWDWRGIGWGPGTKERWYDYEYENRSKPSGEDRDVWIRAADIALRLATIVAVFRGSSEVDLVDLEWAIGVAEYSTEKIVEGLASHSSEDMEQVELIRIVRAKLQQKGKLTKGLLFKTCENKTNDQRKIWAAINHLVILGEAIVIEPSYVGRPTEGKWEWNAKFEER
jgi:hypothetical protein